MAPKTKAKESAKESSKAPKGKESKASKPEKKSAKAKNEEPEEGAAPVVDRDAMEEQEEEAEVAAASRGGSSSSDAALAAASSGAEMSASFKNFRHHPDMENFYRFIYENDLRHEALAIIDEMAVEKAKRKATKGK